MSASKMILRKLTFTIAALLLLMFMFNFLVVNRSRSAAATNAPIVNENVDSDDTASDTINDLGDVLDGVTIDYAA